MPTIQSKKYPDIVAYVTVEDWENMKECGLARRKIVIDDSDIQDTVIPTPQAFTEPVSFDMELSRDELKAALDKAEVEYNPRTPTDKLKELYNKL